MAFQPESTLVEMIRYNNWANGRVMASCLTLAADQLGAAAPGAYGTIRETLWHIIQAEADYIGRMTGSRPEPAFTWDDQTGLADLAAFAERVAAAMLDTVQRVPPEAMVREEEGEFFVEYQARHLFMQTIDHGIEHRTNITTILSGLGLPAPEVDGWAYMWAHTERFGAREGRVEGDAGG